MSHNTLDKKARTRIIKEFLKDPCVESVAEKLGHCHKTVAKYLPPDVRERLRAAQEAKKTQPETAAYDPVAAELDKSRRRLHEEELKDAVRELAFREWFERKLEANTRHLTLPPVRTVTPRRPSTTAKQVGVILHLSDWHYAEKVDSARVMGLNSYDAAETHRRAYRVVKSFLARIDDLEASGRFTYPELVVAANGDFATGTIHDLHKHTDAATPMHAMIECGGLFAQVLRDLAGRFRKVRVHCTVGNHGRRNDRLKGPDPKAPNDSYDWGIYTFAKHMLRDQRNVEFNIADGLFSLYDVAGYRVYQGHGDALRKQLGTIGYSMVHSVNCMSTTHARAGMPLDIVLFGHWHRRLVAEINGTTTFVNRSLIGTTEHGLARFGEVAVPGQEVYFIDPKYGPIEEHTFLATGDDYEGSYPKLS